MTRRRPITFLASAAVIPLVPWFALTPSGNQASAPASSSGGGGGSGISGY
jgi:hypothetical protein